MDKLSERKLLVKIFVVGLLLILAQTLFQNNVAYLEIMGKFSSYIKPFSFGIFIAIMLNPLVDYLEKKSKFSRMISLWLGFLIVGLSLTITMVWFIPNLFESFKDMIDKFPFFMEKFNYYLTEIFKFLRAKNLLLLDAAEIQKAIEDFVVSNLQNIKDIVLSLSLNIVSWLMGVFVFFLGLFLAIYFILYKNYFMRFIENIIFLFYDREKSKKGLDFLIECKDIFLNYMGGRIVISIIVGLIAYFVMLFGKVPYTLVIAVMIGVGNMIPYFGSIVASIIAFLIVVLIDPFKVLYIILAMTIAQTVDGYIVGPLILGKSVGLSSFWIIASVIIMGNIMGTMGMFLGVPIFAILKLVYNKLLEKKEASLSLPKIEETKEEN